MIILAKSLKGIQNKFNFIVYIDSLWSNNT